MAASMVRLAGNRIEPAVSVPTLAAQKLAAVPVPELEPPVLSAGRPSNVALARIAPRVVRIHGMARQRVVVAGHVVVHPVGQLRHAGLGDDHRARLSQHLSERGFVGRTQAVEGEHAAGRRHVDGVDVVLQRDRDAVQRSAHQAPRPLAIALVGLAQRARVDRDDGVQPILVERDAQQVLLHDLARRGAPLLHRAAHVRDARLDHGEGLARRRGLCRRRTSRRLRERGKTRGDPYPQTGRPDGSHRHLLSVLG
jgi:hypothetical protein